MNQLKNKGNLVSYSNNLAEARYSLLPIEQKLIFAMISLISPDDEEFKTYKIDVRQLADYMAIDRKSAMRELDKATDRLMARVLRIPIDDGNRLLKLHWVSHCTLGDKVVEFSFHEKLKPYLLRLKGHFASFKYQIIVSFRGSYTIRIYHLLKTWEYKSFCEYSLTEFREILDIDEEKYPEFKEFNRNVLAPAKREFERQDKHTGLYLSDITFDLQTIRTGRSITHLRFIIKKQAYQEAFNLIPQPDSNEICKALEGGSIETESSAMAALRLHGINDELAEAFVLEQGEEAVLRCVNLFEEQILAGKVKSQGAGLLLTLLKSGAGFKTAFELQVEQQKQTQSELRQQQQQAIYRAERLAKLKVQWDKEYRQQVKQRILASLSVEEQTSLLTSIKRENPIVAGFIKDLSSHYCSASILALADDFETGRANYFAERMREEKLDTESDLSQVLVLS
jgi:plasmid replication initiation protein